MPLKLFVTVHNGRPAVIVGSKCYEFNLLIVTADDRPGEPDGTAVNEQVIKTTPDGSEAILVTNTPDNILFVRTGPKI